VSCSDSLVNTRTGPVVVAANQAPGCMSGTARPPDEIEARGLREDAQATVIAAHTAMGPSYSRAGHDGHVRLACGAR